MTAGDTGGRETMLYAIADIHGYADQLDAALDLVAADGGAEAPIVFLGDYVDRGPDSRGVLQRLIDGRAAGRDWTCLMGNHDRMFHRFISEAVQHDDRIKSHKPWLNPSLGGGATLASYGIEEVASRGTDDLFDAAQAAVPAEHRDFLSALPTWHETQAHIFVHAGIRPGIPMVDQDEDDLVWIRDPFLFDTRDHGKLVVHGHTALSYPQAHANRINLDGGAGFGNPLVPAVWDGEAWFLLTGEGRQPFWSRQAFAA